MIIGNPYVLEDNHGNPDHDMNRRQADLEHKNDPDHMNRRQAARDVRNIRKTLIKAIQLLEDN